MPNKTYVLDEKTADFLKVLAQESQRTQSAHLRWLIQNDWVRRCDEIAAATAKLINLPAGMTLDDLKQRENQDMVIPVPELDAEYPVESVAEEVERRR